MAQSSVASCGGVAAGSPAAAASGLGSEAAAASGLGSEAAAALGSEAAAAFGLGSVRAGLRLARLLIAMRSSAVLARRNTPSDPSFSESDPGC
jgi:hypothetical protein